MKNIEDKIVNILNLKQENEGTGFYIDKNLIVSCYHVLEAGYGSDINTIFFRKCNSTDVFSSHLLFYDEKIDIAVLKTEEYSQYYFFTERYFYKENQLCHSYGFPGNGVVDTWSKGMIYAGKNYRVNLYQLSNANNVTNGFSGAPVWDDENNLIGIMRAISKEDDGRMIHEAFMISVNDLCDFLERFYGDVKEKNYQSIYEKVIAFDDYNYAVYFSLIGKLRNNEIIVPLVGGRLTEFAFGRKESIVERLCKLLFPSRNSSSAQRVRKELMQGEIGMSALSCMEKRSCYSNLMINFFKDIYNSCTVSEFQTEEEAVALIPYMQYAIRFMPDGILEKVAERRNIGTTLVNIGNSEKMKNQRWGLEIYSLCGDLERNVLYSLSVDSEDDDESYKRFANWLGMNQILFVGVEFEGKTLDLCRKLASEEGNHFALVACGKSEEEKKRKREILEDLKIDAILYDENEYAAIESILHKILVDIQNERFKKRISWLDFRFSQHCLCGRDEEIKVLQSFLDSNYDIDNKLPFLWMQIYGSIGTGKSKLIYDFAKERTIDWRLVWIDCNHNEEFFAKIDDFTKHLEKEWRNVLVVFDDFYLHPFSFEECEPLLKKRNNCKLRLLFVHDSQKMIFNNEDLDKQKHYKVTKFKASPLEIKALDRQTIIAICKEYAIYLSISSVDKLYENNVEERMEDLENLIGTVYDECKRTKEVLILYVCLLRTLKWLGLMDAGESIQENVGCVISYMTRKKFLNDFVIEENYINISKYIDYAKERNRNRENPELIDTNMYMPEI